MGKKTGWTLGRTRSLLYRSGKILGDVNAVKRGKVSASVTNRVVGKASARLSRGFSRGILKFFK